MMAGSFTNREVYRLKIVRKLNPECSNEDRGPPLLNFSQFFSSAEPHQYSEEHWHDCVFVYSPL